MLQIIIFAILQCIALAGVGLIGILAFTGAVAPYDAGAEATGILIAFSAFSAYMIPLFLFEIWTIIVAKRARQEIADGTTPNNDTDIPKV